MKRNILLLALVLGACTGNNKADISGRWMEVLPPHTPYKQGMQLNADGTASAVGMATLHYDRWEVKEGKLILDGESIGNGQTLTFTDTLDIVQHTADTLVVERRGRKICYVRKPVSGTEPAVSATGEVYTLEGELRMGHEVRSFKPADSEKEYWIVDRSGRLDAQYDKVTGGQKNGKPVKAVLKLEYNGKWDDGFAADYDGVFLVREIIGMD